MFECLLLILRRLHIGVLILHVKNSKPYCIYYNINSYYNFYVFFGGWENIYSHKVVEN